MENLSSFSPEELERGRLLFANETRFMMGVVKLDQLPEVFDTEVAFAGRSNVGKSSLLNALTGCKDIARTSNTPGRTRELNYFLITDDVAIVDMPGYGYAKASKSLVAGWQRLVKKYLNGRPGLRRVFVLIDARHGIKTTDLPTLDMLDTTAVNYQIVLTKADKILAKERDKVLKETTDLISKRPAAHPLVHLTSSAKNIGIAELRAEICNLSLS